MKTSACTCALLNFNLPIDLAPVGLECSTSKPPDMTLRGAFTAWPELPMSSTKDTHCAPKDLVVRPPRLQTVLQNIRVPRLKARCCRSRRILWRPSKVQHNRAPFFARQRLKLAQSELPFARFVTLRRTLTCTRYIIASNARGR